jgi:hypothetical protein
MGLGSNNFSKPLCGYYTETGLNTQAYGPVFDGKQAIWVEETMDLADFIGQTVQIDFIFGSDGAIEADGFYFDDVRINYALPTSRSNDIVLPVFNLFQNEPNPASGSTVFQWRSAGNIAGENSKLLIFNITGKVVAEKNINLNAENNTTFDIRHLAPGIYTYLIRNDLYQSNVMKMTVVK